jgi:hypothetical protein
MSRVSAQLSKPDFESARFVPGPLTSLTNAVLVGWVFYAGTNQFEELPYNRGVDGVYSNWLILLRWWRFPKFCGSKYAVYFHQDYVGNSPFATAQRQPSHQTQSSCGSKPRDTRASSQL